MTERVKQRSTLYNRSCGGLVAITSERRRLTNDGQGSGVAPRVSVAGSGSSLLEPAGLAQRTRRGQLDGIDTRASGGGDWLAGFSLVALPPIESKRSQVMLAWMPQRLTGKTFKVAGSCKPLPSCGKWTTCNARISWDTARKSMRPTRFWLKNSRPFENVSKRLKRPERWRQATDQIRAAPSANPQSNSWDPTGLSAAWFGGGSVADAALYD